MSGLLFGTGGAPHSAKPSSTIDGIKRIAELGLGCMEIEFVRGVRMSEAGARLVADIATKEGVKLSAHAPYFINFNAHEPEKIKASQDRLLQTARIASICGAKSIVFHIAFYLGDPPEKAYTNVKKHLEEVLNLSTELNGIAPCIDFAHWHARTGRFNSYPEFVSIMQQIKERLGRPALDNMHIHVSGIAYGKKGEIKHLNLKDSDFQYVELIKALKDYNANGLLICESPNLEEDALLLQETYNTL